jgi:spore photoproduct lyase
VRRSGGGFRNCLLAVCECMATQCNSGGRSTSGAAVMPLFDEVYVDASFAGSDIVERIREGIGDCQWEVCTDFDAVIREKTSYEADPCAAGKRVMMIRPYRGQLVKACPGTANHICCGYKIINVMTNCPMDCSYCILQGYLNNPCVTVYPDFPQIFHEIEEVIAAQPHRLFRFGTGELGDSLVLDHLIGFAQAAVPFFAARKNAVLELKTKSARVGHLLSLDHHGKTIISWSLNTPRVIEEEEHGSATLVERLAAARRCVAAGYPVGFHFDPLILYPGWEEDYKGVIDLLFASIDPASVRWISLGGLRFPPALKRVAVRRFPETGIFTGELVPGADGKLRYLKPLRVELYRRMVAWLRAYDERLFIYLCMERGDVWEGVFCSAPADTAGLNQRFEAHVSRSLEVMA